jgi:hypothetical protein
MGFDVLAFTLNLSGMVTTAGSPGNDGVLDGGVMAELGAADSVDADEVALMAPGIAVARIRVPLGLATDIGVTGILDIFASASGPGNVTTDFSDTFDVTKIQLFDSSGHLVDDNVTLTDAAGNVLGAAAANPSSPAVPEPSSVLLLIAGLGLLAFPRSRRNRASMET